MPASVLNSFRSACYGPAETAEHIHVSVCSQIYVHAATAGKRGTKYRPASARMYPRVVTGWFLIDRVFALRGSLLASDWSWIKSKAIASRAGSYRVVLCNRCWVLGLGVCFAWELACKRWVLDKMKSYRQQGWLLQGGALGAMLGAWLGCLLCVGACLQAMGLG
jgi:hypothetical protein